MNQKCQEKKQSSEKKEEVTVPLTEEPEKKVHSPFHSHSQLSTTTFIILGLSAALCDVFYAPCTAMGNKDPIPLSPYVVSLLLSHPGHLPGGESRVLRLRLPLRLVLFSPSLHRSIVMRHPLKGDKCTFSDWIHATWKQRWPGRSRRGVSCVAIWSAFLLALGNWGYASAGSQLGFAIGYALSRGTLLVSALLGVFVYREFNGADAKTWAVQIAALYLFFAAILLEAMAKCCVCCEYTWLVNQWIRVS